MIKPIGTLIFCFALLATANAFAQSEDPKIEALRQKAISCFEAEARDFLSSNFKLAADLKIESNTHFFGTGKDFYSIFVLVKAKSEATGCEFGMDLMRSSLSLSINNHCGVSEKFLHFYLAFGDTYACTPPHSGFRAVSVNDGYDQYGQPLNPRMEFKGSHLVRGSCLAQKAPLFFRNISTSKPTAMTLGLMRLHRCLMNSSPELRDGVL